MKTSADWFVPFALPSLNGLWASVTQHKMQTACMAAAELMAAFCLFGEELADTATTEPKWGLCGWKPGWILGFFRVRSRRSETVVTGVSTRSGAPLH